MGVKMVSFDELVRTSDFISLHAPLTKQTRKMFSAPQFKAMKNTAYLINCARGGLVDSDALYDALVAGELAGAALMSLIPSRCPPITSCSRCPTSSSPATRRRTPTSPMSTAKPTRLTRLHWSSAARSPPPRSKDPWLLAEAQDEGFGGV